MDQQFDNRYQVKLTASENPLRAKKRRFLEEDQMRILKAHSHRPESMKFFENTMECNSPIKTAPRIGYFCNMVPVEIIKAMGAEAVRLDCGNSALALTGEELFSGEICPIARASLGSIISENSLAASCDIFILPASCDAKRKIAEILADFKPTFVWNLPPEQNYERYSGQVYLESLRMVKFLENLFKRKLSAKKLREMINLSQKRTSVIRRIQQARIENPRVLLPADLLLIVQSSLFRTVDLKQWLQGAENLLGEIGSIPKDTKNLRSKLVLTGAPIVWPNFKVLNILEECGADIVADTLCTGAQSLYDPVVTDEWSIKSMLLALSGKYIFASLCPCFISQSRRISRILELVNETGAKGVVNYSLRLCQLFDMENYRIDKICKQNKISFLNIRTDYSLEDTEQLRVRIEAFLETL